VTVRLVGIDVDGTLVGSSGKVDPRVWEMAAAASARGIRLALCSGRPAFGVAMEYARTLDPLGWHAFQNGASILDLASGQSRSVPLPSRWVSTLIEQARASGQVLELYNDRELAAESTSVWAREHAALLGVQFAPRAFESLAVPVVRAQWLLSPQRAREMTATPHPGLEVAQSTSPLMPGVQFVGLTDQSASKATAMRVIAGQYGVALEDVMYVGDSGNDLSALRVVGHPIAMGNADAAVLAAAARTVATADQGGVAEALAMALGL